MYIPPPLNSVSVESIPVYHIHTLQVSQSFADLQAIQDEFYIGQFVLVLDQVIS